MTRSSADGSAGRRGRSRGPMWCAPSCIDRAPPYQRSSSKCFDKTTSSSNCFDRTTRSYFSAVLCFDAGPGSEASLAYVACCTRVLARGMPNSWTNFYHRLGAFSFQRSYCTIVWDLIRKLLYHLLCRCACPKNEKLYSPTRQETRLGRSCCFVGGFCAVP